VTYYCKLLLLFDSGSVEVSVPVNSNVSGILRESACILFIVSPLAANTVSTFFSLSS